MSLCHCEDVGNCFLLSLRVTFSRRLGSEAGAGFWVRGDNGRLWWFVRFIFWFVSWLWITTLKFRQNKDKARERVCSNTFLSSRLWKWFFLDDTKTNASPCTFYYSRVNLDWSTVDGDVHVFDGIILIQQLKHVSLSLFFFFSSSCPFNCMRVVKRAGYSQGLTDCWLGESLLRGCKLVPFVPLFKQWRQK